MENTPVSFIRRAGTLFICIYLFLYMFPFPIDQIPGTDKVLDHYSDLLDWFAMVFGKTILHLTQLQKPAPSGSGDSLFDYVRILSWIMLAAVGTIITLVADRKKRSFHSVNTFLRIYARYYLGLYLLVYGFGKLFAAQFSPPDMFRLEQPFGSASPMGLLWTFMGASKSYTVFSGIMELIAGYLLFFRRTKALGSLVAIVVLMNVMTMNFCYDVPVKIFSSHLVLISLYVLGHDLWKLLLFLFGKTPPPLIYPEYTYNKRYQRLLSRWGKAVILVGFSYVFFNQGLEESKMPPPSAMSVKFSGVYKPVKLITGKDTLLSQQHPAIKKIFITGEVFGIVTGLDSATYYIPEFDTLTKTIHLTNRKDSTQQLSFAYQLEKNKIKLNGNWRGETLQAEFTRKEVKDYLLVNRGFHWVNEMPFNR